MTHTRKLKTEGNGKNLTLLFVFCYAVLVFLFFSLFYKVIQIAGQSTFDSRHRFTIAIQTTPLHIFTVNPVKKSASVMIISVSPKNFGSKVTGDNIGKLLKIPVDGVIKIEKNIYNNNIEKELFTTILRYNSVQTKLTIFDVFGLWWFVKAIPAHATGSEEFMITIKNGAIEESGRNAKQVSQLFVDDALQEEKLSIQIINGTGVSGFGSRLAKLLTNMGGNIIIVSTADLEIATSEIAYYGKESYTLSRLALLLSYPVKPLYSPGIADVIITLGKDSTNTSIF